MAEQHILEECETDIEYDFELLAMKKGQEATKSIVVLSARVTSITPVDIHHYVVLPTQIYALMILKKTLGRYEKDRKLLIHLIETVVTRNSESKADQE